MTNTKKKTGRQLEQRNEMPEKSKTGDTPFIEVTALFPGAGKYGATGDTVRIVAHELNPDRFFIATKEGDSSGWLARWDLGYSYPKSDILEYTSATESQLQTLRESAERPEGASEFTDIHGSAFPGEDACLRLTVAGANRLLSALAEARQSGRAVTDLVASDGKSFTLLTIVDDDTSTDLWKSSHYGCLGGGPSIEKVIRYHLGLPGSKEPEPQKTLQEILGMEMKEVRQ